MDEAGGAPAGARDAKDQRPPTIVLADDDPSIVDLLTEVLEDEGYRVLRASDGVQAWVLCQRHRPSVVISDVMMPKMNGIELVSRLHKSNDSYHPAVILMSAVRRPLSRPGVTFLPKPFDLDDILNSVASGLEERSSA
jgi:two-component system sensor histidine kinase/response regulator